MEADGRVKHPSWGRRTPCKESCYLSILFCSHEMRDDMQKKPHMRSEGMKKQTEFCPSV